MIADTYRAGRFFLGYLPSFTQLGFVCRGLDREPVDWDFTGQHWLVTGASSGIGRQIAQTAASAGAFVTATARSRDKLQALADSARGSPGAIEPLPLDLSVQSNIRHIADTLNAMRRPLDVLVNNAGVLLNEPEVTDEGFELAFATNLLAPFNLTTTLNREGLLRRDATIINMSSGGAYNVPLTLSALDKQRGYQGALAYAHHKRAQVALNAYWRAHAETGQQYYVTHPGWVDTPGVEQSLPLFRAILRPLLRNVAAGADTALWLAQNRPAQPSHHGIWFDRTLRPDHALPGTRHGDSSEDLVRYLNQTLEA